MIATVHRAPWCRALVVTTTLSVLILLGVAWALFDALPAQLPWRARVALQSLPLVVLAISMLFVVRRYELTHDALRIQRLGWSTVIPLHGLQRAWADPRALRALRLCGNGGLFSISGLYWNRSLGRFRAFANDPARAVVLEVAGRKVVVTPEQPADFLADLRRFHPQLEAST